MESICRPTLPQSEGGTVPESLSLADNVKEVRPVKNAKDVGILPVRELLKKCKSLRLIKFDSEVGMVPVNWF